MKKIVLDTNFLIDLIRFKVKLGEIDELINEPYRLIVLNSVIRELERISDSKTKESGHAKIALELANSKSIEILDTKEKSADKAILALIDKNTLVATDDRKLRENLKALETKTIYLRSKKHLAVS
jgi:rRNA-processing protein FCF1